MTDIFYIILIMTGIIIATPLMLVTFSYFLTKKGKIMFTIPIIDVKADTLDMTLYALGLRLNQLSQAKNPAFDKLIADKSLAIQFLSGDDGSQMARYFRFVDGRFGQAIGQAKNPDLTIHFKDSATGLKLIAKGDVAVLMTAIQDGDVTVSGDYKLVLWLAGVVKEATKISEPYKGYLDTAKPYAKKATQFFKNKFGN